MEIKNFRYSLKIIPIPTKSNYLKCLTEKTENFIRRLRCKDYHFCKDNLQPANELANGYFGFKTTTPPPNEHLNAFENNLYDLIQKVEFTNVQNTFQQKLKNGVHSIKSSSNTLVFADKITNLYELSQDHYEKLLHNNITQTYQKMCYQTKKKTDREAKKFAKSLNLDKRMECYSDQSAFITLKDHKANFKNNTKCRLINPSKNEVGPVNKHYLNLIISMIAEKSGVNQWKNTSTVIKWFENLQNKQKCTFKKFYFADFYPSITKHLLERSIQYAKSFDTIEHKALKDTLLARKSLLFSKDEI